MYQWICEKCGEDNRSGQNVCRNLSCKFIFHGTKEQTVKCAKCKRAPVGNTLYRKGRNTTFPLKKLSSEEIFHPDYEAYGPAGRKFLNALKPFVGYYLCQLCHPWNLGLKIDSSLSGSEDVLLENVKDRERVKERVASDSKTYDRVAANIKAKLVKIREANPEMTDQEELELAKRLIHKVKDDEFQVDQIDWELRRIIRGAVASKISFRKNVSKDRIYEKLYRYWRIEEARQRKDMSHLKKVLKEEAKRASEIGNEFIEDARKGPDLISQIEKLTKIMSDKSDEIALREHRILSEGKMGDKYDARMTVLFGRIKKLEQAVTKSNDPEYLKKALPILTRTRNRYSFATEQASHFLTPLAIGYEREVIARMQRKFFTHYAPLLRVARNIIFWDIKEDMWKGPSKGMTEAQKDQAGYGKYFSLEFQKDLINFGKIKDKQPSQTISYKGYPSINEKSADKAAADEYLASHGEFDPKREETQHEQLLEELSVFGVYSVVRCDICERLTSTPKMLFGINAVRRVDVLTGMDLKPKVEDFSTKEMVKDIGKDDRKMIMKIDLMVCPSCHEASSLKDLARAQIERQKRLRAEWQEKTIERKREKDLLSFQRKQNARFFETWLVDALFEAREDLKARGVDYSAPIRKVDLRVGGKVQLMMIVVPKFGVPLPSQIEKHGWPIEIVVSPRSFFQMNYAYHAMEQKEISSWSMAARRKGVKLTRLGILTGMNHRISSISDVAAYLGVELPVMPMGYWKGIYQLGGIKEVHPNFRDLVAAGSEFDFNLMYPYGKPTEAELQRQKAIKMDRSRRRTEENKFWDALRTRGKGGPSPKTIPKHRRPPAREDRRGFHKETPMGLLPETIERLNIKDSGQFKVSPGMWNAGVYQDLPPELKDTKDFLMLPPPSTGDKGTRHTCTNEENSEFYRQKFSDGGAKYVCKGVPEGEDGENAKFSKKTQQECDEKFRRMDPKTFQRVRLPKK